MYNMVSDLYCKIYNI